MTPGSKSFYRLTKPAVFLSGLLPLLYLILRTFNVAGPGLGANPIEALLHELGRWGLKFLFLYTGGDTCTSLDRLVLVVEVPAYARSVSLFFTIVLHFMTYAVLDQGLDKAAILEDIVKRPYITLGMTGFVLLIPLAITSTRGMMRSLGRRWKKLHRLVYVIAILGVWHFYWQVKLDTFEPVVYALILALLLLSRIYYRGKMHSQSSAASSL